MHKVILIGWGVMLAAFIYSTRELQSNQNGTTTVTSSNYPSVLPRNQQGGSHTRTKYEPAQSSRALGVACRTTESSFRGGTILSCVSESDLLERQSRKPIKEFF